MMVRGLSHDENSFSSRDSSGSRNICFTSKWSGKTHYIVIMISKYFVFLSFFGKRQKCNRRKCFSSLHRSLLTSQQFFLCFCCYFCFRVFLSDVSLQCTVIVLVVRSWRAKQIKVKWNYEEEDERDAFLRLKSLVMGCHGACICVYRFIKIWFCNFFSRIYAFLHKS